MVTEVRKDRSGRLVAETDHTELIQGKYTLKVVTRKGLSKTLDTSVSCSVREGHWETFRMYVDYYETVEKTCPSRITAKAVAEQHEKVLAQMPTLVARAEAHYSKEVGNV